MNPDKSEQFRAFSADIGSDHGGDTCAEHANTYASTAIERPSGDRTEQATGATGARSDAIGRLASMLATFAAVGDLDGARAMYETIGHLLRPVSPAGDMTHHLEAGERDEGAGGRELAKHAAERGGVILDIARARAQGRRR